MVVRSEGQQFDLAVIGGGAMGEAFVAGLLREVGRQAPDRVLIVEPVDARRDHLAKTLGVVVRRSIDASVSKAGLVLLAVKPQQFGAVAGELQTFMTVQQTVLSLMAGVPLSSVCDALHCDRGVRLMPNVMCRVGAGMIVWIATSSVPEQHKQFLRASFDRLGAAIEVADEKYVDMATAVSGSGPAFAFLVLEALTDAAVHVGFPRDQATVLARQTVLGAAVLLRETDQHPAVLKNSVTSPGGTTAAGLLVLEQRGVRAAIEEAVLAAYSKTQHLR